MNAPRQDLHSDCRERVETIDRRSSLEELGVQYEAVNDDRLDIESFKAIDVQMRKRFRGMKQVITSLNGRKLPIDHRFGPGVWLHLCLAATRHSFGARVAGFPGGATS